MKKLLYLIYLLPLSAFGQTKTWLGTSSVIWPAQTTNSLQLSSGDVTAKINNTKTSGQINGKEILALQYRGTNLVDFDVFGSGYFGYNSRGAYYDTIPKVAITSSEAHGASRAMLNLGSYDDVNNQTVQNNIDMATSTNPSELDFKMWGNDGTGIEFTPFSSSLPFLFNATAADLTGTLLDIQWQGIPVASFSALGNLALTSINNVTITAPATNAVLTIDDGKTLHVTGDVTALSGSHTGTSSGTNTGDQTSVTGNAGTATALQTARTINGTSFDGTANITVTAAAGTLTGSTLASGVTASSLTSFGTAPALGDATATTSSAGNSSTHVATTAFVANSFQQTLDKVRTPVTVSNSVAETTFYTKSITANTIGASGTLRLSMRGSWINNSGSAQSFTLKIKFGGTTLYDATSSTLSSTSSTRTWSLQVELANNGTTSSQVGGFNLAVNTTGSTTTGVGPIASNSINAAANLAAGTVDTTSNQTFVVTWTNGATGAVSTTMDSATLVLVP